MGVYEISVYDKSWRLMYRDYRRFDDLQQAELRAEKEADDLGYDLHWKVRRIR